MPAYSRGWPAGREVEARGLKSAEDFDSSARALSTTAARQDGWWSVVFRRALAPGREGSLELTPGTRVQLACAIWNGAARDHDAQKSISIWHQLTIGR